jgi:hypothetical protein
MGRRHDTLRCDNPCQAKHPETGEPLFDKGNPVPADTGYPTEYREQYQQYLPITNALVGVTVGLGVATALVGTFAFRKRNREHARVRLQGAGLAVRW